MITLSLNETRVLGVLFEKERTTLDQYPLSLNALTNGCNQKSNREPVLNLSESEVQATVDSLTGKSLVAEVAVGSRVKKYRQRFGNTQFSEFKLSLQEQSVISVLFLRGPQTPGELRTRSNRLCEFRDVEEVEQALQELIDRSGDTYVKKLPREPGKRESRYAHLFSGDFFIENIKAVNINNEKSENRVSVLEQQVTNMQEEIDELKQLWAELNE
ncbi:MAG: hypothetical protein ACJAUP_000640 [Cellvibrionaceae bacterium]|jgi:uncharacterized protein YceH (UPF0502 family)